MSISELCDAVWDVPHTAAESNLRTYVARLRQQLHDPEMRETRLVTRSRGYHLVVYPGELDWAVFEELADRGRAAAAQGDFAAAAEFFARALRLWRGRPFDDLEPGPALRLELTRLWEQYLAVVEEHARARIELGEHEVVVGELRRLTAEHPTREGLSSLLMLALYRCGRQTEALEVFTETRRRLVTEVGVEPGAGLRLMQQRVLNADPALEPAGTGTPDMQTAQPIGVAVAAVALPPLAAGLGPAAPMLALAAFSLLMAALVVVFVRDPRRPREDKPDRAGTPYRTPVLWRLHGAAGLLVIPQFAVATYALVFLVDEHGWDPAAAGRILALAQVCGALGRIGAGMWSDRVGSRLRPYRLLAGVIGTIMLALAAAAHGGAMVTVAVLMVAAVVTMSPNGLAFTAVAEYAGHLWAGRALGAQNTVQNAVAVMTPPLLGAVVTGSGYAAAFALAAAFPLAAIGAVPVTAEKTTPILTLSFRGGAPKER